MKRQEWEELVNEAEKELEALEKEVWEVWLSIKPEDEGYALSGEIGIMHGVFIVGYISSIFQQAETAYKKKQYAKAYAWYKRALNRGHIADKQKKEAAAELRKIEEEMLTGKLEP